jgi:Raf kinase inhibitor-like YbhB/YbcL family protein
MKLWSNSFANGARIPEKHAFGKHDPKTHIALTDNVSPHLAWSDAPAGTRSFVVVCHDSDAPSKGDDVNKEGRTVPASLPRVDFTHLILLDVPATKTSIAEGELAKGVTARGKPGPDAPGGMRQGINDYTGWFAGDADMAGTYNGYDGPCPPWNDEIVHRYHFTVFALDVEKCPAEGELTRANVLAAIEGHTLATAELLGTYAINPSAK